jgi:L-malate glycosyltransferase
MKTRKKIKIVYLVNHPVPYGANKALLNILDGVVDHGVCPSVVMATKGAMCEELKKRNIDYHLIQHYFSIYPSLCSLRDVILFIPRFLRTAWYNYLAVKKMTSLVKEFKPDLIHTNIGPDHIGFHVAIKNKIPHVWHIREYQDLYFNMHPLFSKDGFIKKLQRSNNYPISITKGIYNHFEMSDNARVVYDGVMKESQIQFIAHKKKYFLFVGRLEVAKGIRTLIEAYIEFCKDNDDFELQIAGDCTSSYLSVLNKLVAEAQLTRRVRFLGFRTDVYELMANGTALVVPSRYEGFGFITAEAMFNGCLVIGNNSGGTKEIIEKENLGILYSSHDELVAAMKTVVKNGIESYFPMIKKAQERAVALYSQEQNADAVYKFYQEILNRKRIKKICKY